MLDSWRRCKNPGEQADAKLNQCSLLHDLLLALEDVAWLGAIDVADPKVYTLHGAIEEVSARILAPKMHAPCRRCPSWPNASY